MSVLSKGMEKVRKSTAEAVFLFFYAQQLPLTESLNAPVTGEYELSTTLSTGDQNLLRLCKDY